MEFRTGDEVVHRAYGVGNVLRHEKQQVAGGEPRWYYVLAIGPSTVWVPMHADGATSLRAVTSKQELDQCRTILKGRPSILERDHNKRRLEVKTRCQRQRGFPARFKILLMAISSMRSISGKPRTASKNPLSTKIA